MTLTLRFKDGEEVIDKIYSPGFIKGRFMRNAVQLKKEINLDDLSAEEIDRLVAFACEFYGNQFTVDDFYDGVENEKMIPILFEILTVAITGAPLKKDVEPESGETGNE